MINLLCQFIFNYCTKGRLSTVLSKSAQHISQICGGNLVTMLQLIATVLVSLVWGFYENWSVSLVCIGAISMVTCVGIGLMYARANADKLTPELMMAGHYSSECIVNIRVVRTIQGAEDLFMENYNKTSNLHKEKKLAEAWGNAKGMGFAMGILNSDILFLKVKRMVVYTFFHHLSNLKVKTHLKTI